MPSRILVLAVALVAASTVACRKKEPTIPSTWANFECKDRKASYLVANSLGGEEAGVLIDCAGGPRVLRWADQGGSRVEDSTALTPGEFDDVWKRIEGVGWHHLGDCPPDQGKDIPIYTFDVADWEESKTFQCEALRPPFPWITLVEELDQLAAMIRGEKGKNTMDITDPDEKPAPK